DTTAPAAPTVLAVATDDRVNAAEKSGGVVVSGTAEAGSTVAVAWGAVTRTAVAAADGTWSVDFSAGQIPSDLVPQLTATATDAAGNASGTTVRAVAIDTAPPGLPSVAMVAGDDVVNAAERAAGVSVSGTAEPGSTVVVDWGTATRNAVASAGGTWTTSFAPGYVPNENATQIFVSATDAAGNAGPAGSRPVSVDTVAPAAPTITGASDTGVARPVISGTAEAGSTLVLSIDSGGNGTYETHYTLIVPGTGAWSVNTATASPSSGTFAGFSSLTPQALRAVATDAAGNAGPAGTLTYSTTQFAPDLLAADDSGVSSTDDVTNVVRPGFAIDPPPTGATVVLFVDGVRDAGATYAGGVVTPSTDLLEGTRSITYAYESGGTVGAPSPALVVTVDTTSPTFAGGTVGDDVSGATAVGPVTFSFATTEPVFGFTSADVDAFGGNGTPVLVNTGGNAYTFVVTPLPEMQGTLTVQVPAGNGTTTGFTDAAGNANPGIAPVFQDYDTQTATAGTGTSTTGVYDNGPGAGGTGVRIAPGADTSDATPRFVVTLGAVLDGGRSLVFERDGVQLRNPFTSAGPTFQFQDGVSASGPLAPGEHSYAAFVVDSAGNRLQLDLTPSAPGHDYVITVI
ncbi:MAG TPA: Ig-like domain-containing protein, partial [Burkholderiaceae bacterium]|nr:Ig-like domain-containing protein [Burkholderiaceae bacterium]